jgi:mRNA-degrading endonuclease RelE of RelBE toxin-antitoxin system
MTTPLVQVDFSARFKRDIKRLFKKHRHIQADVQPIITALENGETPGDQVSGIEEPVYKVRIKNRDVERGKSGGYRLMYYIKTKDFIVLLTIYSKSETDDVSAEFIKDIISKYNFPPDNQD